MRNSSWLDTLKGEFARAQSLGALGDIFVSHFLNRVRADVVELSLISPPHTIRRLKSRGTAPESSPLFQNHDGECIFQERDLRLPVVVSQLKDAPRFLQEELDAREIQSLLVLPFHWNGRQIGWVSAIIKQPHSWKAEEIAELSTISSLLCAEVARFFNTALPTKEQAQIDEDRERFERLVQLGNLFIIELDAQLHVTSIRGNVRRMLGIAPERLIQDPSIWSTVIHETDYQEFMEALRQADGVGAFSREIRVTSAESGEARYLLVKAVRDRGPENNAGWEIFGFDVTDKHRTEKELVWERKRVEALYEVSRTIQGAGDPAIVSLKGVRSLVRATKSDRGIACFYDRASNQIEIVAADGFSEDSVAGMSRIVNGSSLIRAGIESPHGFIIGELEQDDRVAAPEVMRSEGLRSFLVVPLLIEGEAIGALALFSRRRDRYRESDRELVEAAARQITLSVKQAEYLARERSQASMVTALYHLSHELSRLMTPREMAAHAFPIIQGELACKRMWLGIMNDQGTHILGQAGLGPAVRRSLIELQIDLSERHDVLDEALRTREPTLFFSDTPTECSSLNRVRERLGLGMCVLVPLSSLGQVVGLLILEPAVPSAAVVQRKLGLLKSMAGEIATVMLARRFEAKMADADKMRMAGVLASGVAHNFNNLLQAVMGQASLIEMQVAADSAIRSSTRMIIDSAGKGASLVKQLMGFSNQGGAVRRTISLNSLFNESEELYRSLLGARTKFELKLGDRIPPVYADQGQIQQVITNLLMNARDAVKDTKDGVILLSTSEVRIRAGEVDPDLAPGVYLRIDVEDNGIGMDPERQARCFEPFYSTKNLDSRTGLSLTGAGLGLSSAYSIVKNHEGLIAVRSRIGEGTVFSIYLPALTVRAEDRLTPAVGRVVAIGFQRSNDLERQVTTLGFALTYRGRATADRVEAEKGNVAEKKLFILNSQRLSREVLREQLAELLDSITIVAAEDPVTLQSELGSFAPDAQFVSFSGLGSAIERGINFLLKDTMPPPEAPMMDEDEEERALPEPEKTRRGGP